jgi:hypothetical protein
MYGGRVLLLGGAHACVVAMYLFLGDGLLVMREQRACLVAVHMSMSVSYS